jgi:hypothetical protein
MEPVYESYFRERLDQYWAPEQSFTTRPVPNIGPGSWADQRAHYMVRSAVEHARPVALQSGPVPGQELRSDAELLLYLAFFELVARPVTMVQGPQDYNLPGAIAADIEAITKEAVNSNDGGPVSAHDVVNATTRLWPQLQSANWNLWDR